MSDADIHFYWDPVCPFAWMTSRWVHKVAAQTDYSVDWRFISLRVLNASVDYDEHFPAEYRDGHTAGLMMLRVAAAARAAHGREVMGDLYSSIGTQIWDVDPPADGRMSATTAKVTEIMSNALARIDLPTDLAAAADDDTWDVEITEETEYALSLTGKDVGTPIIQFVPPDGVAFFGPVISRLPDDEQAVELWDHVIALAGFPGFAELKRSLRELPQLRGLGVADAEVGISEDWHGGSRRLKN